MFVFKLISHQYKHHCIILSLKSVHLKVVKCVNQCYQIRVILIQLIIFLIFDAVKWRILCTYNFTLLFWFWSTEGFSMNYFWQRRLGARSHTWIASGPNAPIPSIHSFCGKFFNVDVVQKFRIHTCLSIICRILMHSMLYKYPQF